MNHVDIASEGDLADALRAHRQLRDCVLVVGSGLNIQAATEAGYPHQDGWSDLLLKMGARVGLSKKAMASLPEAHLARWEKMLCHWAAKERVFPYEAERKMQNFICDELRRQEKESVEFPLYRRIAAAGFTDIISLNFDRRLALSCKGQHKFMVGPRPCPLGAQGEPLFRHSLLQFSSRLRTRIWYPHGDVKKAATIKFGVRRYGFYLGVIRELLGDMDRSWRMSSFLRRMNSPKHKSYKKNAIWLHVFLNRPLVFLGCSLSVQEWPLWWLLRLRAAMHTDEVPTYFLTIAPRKPYSAQPHFSLHPFMQVIAYDSSHKLWSSFLDSISDYPGHVI